MAYRFHILRFVLALLVVAQTHGPNLPRWEVSSVFAEATALTLFVDCPAYNVATVNFLLINLNQF